MAAAPHAGLTSNIRAGETLVEVRLDHLAQRFLWRQAKSAPCPILHSHRTSLLEDYASHHYGQAPESPIDNPALQARSGPGYVITRPPAPVQFPAFQTQTEETPHYQ
jgi:hypothetical protein